MNVLASDYCTSAFRLSLLVAVGTVFAGCGSYGVRSQPYFSEGKSLAYVVELPDELQLKWVGTTVFNNSSAVQAVPGWNVAQHVAENVETVLRDSAKFTQLIHLKSLLLAPKGMPVTDTNADVVLRIRPGRSGMADQDQLGTNQGYSALGLFQRSAFGMGPYSSVTAALECELLDARSGKSLRKTSASENTSGVTLMDKSMHLNAEQLDAVMVTAASAANHASTVCLENLGLKPWVRSQGNQGHVPKMKF
jgi:hypothetical protein